MALYVLDTDVCSYIMKRTHAKVIDKLRRVPIEEIVISVITQAELLYGVRLSAKPKMARVAFDAFVKHVDVLEFSSEAAHHYAEIRANLKTRGLPIGANDLLIAAHARSLNAILVTNNVREFGRVKGLTVENWAR